MEAADREVALEALVKLVEPMVDMPEVVGEVRLAAAKAAVGEAVVEKARVQLEGRREAVAKVVIVVAILAATGATVACKEVMTVMAATAVVHMEAEGAVDLVEATVVATVAGRAAALGAVEAWEVRGSLRLPWRRPAMQARRS
jgi:hypothetical protein